MDRFVVSRHDDGRRLDKVIRKKWPSLPLGAMMKAFRKKQVRVDGARASFDQRLVEGQEVLVPWESAPTDVGAKRTGGHLVTVYRDESLWVVSKPAGLLSQPDKKGGDSVVTRAFLPGSSFQPQAVNRLDRNTSGIMVLALSGGALRDLSSLWRDGEMEKVYLALVVGDLPEEGRIDAPLSKDGSSNKVFVDSKGQSSLTLYRRLACGGGLSLCLVTLITGRSHQIRVHMSHIGHPVLGDVKYGDRALNGVKGAKRPMLHAFSVSFPEMPGDLSSLSSKTLRAPMPEDMADMCSKNGIVPDRVFLP